MAALRGTEAFTVRHPFGGVPLLRHARAGLRGREDPVGVHDVHVLAVTVVGGDVQRLDLAPLVGDCVVLPHRVARDQVREVWPEAVAPLAAAGLHQRLHRLEDRGMVRGGEARMTDYAVLEDFGHCEGWWCRVGGGENGMN